MQIPDLINGLFESVSGLMLWINVRQILRDKAVKGIHWIPTLFFTIWGYWNLFYYPHLNQWLSFAGGLIMVAGNTTWIVLMIKYWKRSRNPL
jgi:hypothetical protein